MESILRPNPREVIVVDGLSVATSGLAEIAGVWLSVQVVSAVRALWWTRRIVAVPDDAGVADAGALPSSDGEIVCALVPESGRAS